jgi:glycosyltransferase involved in cell wall biosynthesis
MNKNFISNKQISIFLRKKVIGQNSLEECAYNLIKGISNATLYIFPEYFNGVKNIIKNIKYSKKNEGVINHIFQPSHAFLCLFLKNTIVTYHDVFTMFENKNIISKYIYILLDIIVPVFFAKKLICVSNVTKKELLHYCPKFLRNKIEVIYNTNGERIEYSDHVFNCDMPSILHIGTVERKNLLRVVDALSNIKCVLIIVGLLTNIQKKILEEKNITYISYSDVPYSKIIELYKTCDIVSFPSLAEGFGLIVIEGQKSGRCVLSSNIEIIKEVGADGYVEVNPYDVSSIRDGFLSIIKNAELREKILKNGLRNVKRFDFDIFIKSYKILYEKLIK